MKRLGYTRFVAQGGDWGDAVSEQMALQAPPELLAIHTNMPATVPDDVAKALQFGGPAPAGMSADEKNAYEQLDFFYKHGLGYAQEMTNRPQTLYGVEDSPAGLAAWMLDHDARSYALIARVFDGKTEGLTRDDILDNITLYWLTGTAVSSARLYWENKLAFFAPKHITIPVAVSVFSRRDLCGAAKLDQESVFPTSFITTSSPRAGTLLHGSSRPSSASSFVQPSVPYGLSKDIGLQPPTKASVGLQSLPNQPHARIVIAQYHADSGECFQFLKSRRIDNAKHPAS